MAEASDEASDEVTGAAPSHGAKAEQPPAGAYVRPGSWRSPPSVPSPVPAGFRTGGDAYATTDAVCHRKANSSPVSTRLVSRARISKPSNNNVLTYPAEMVVPEGQYKQCEEVAPCLITQQWQS